MMPIHCVRADGFDDASEFVAEHDGAFDDRRADPPILIRVKITTADADGLAAQ
jgi:hypothetical protein